MSLSPLDQADTGKLLAELLDGASLPPEIEALVLARSGGNPLYAAEYVRMLVDRGLLRRGDAGDLARSRELPLPESVQGIVAARLDALPAEEKLLVQDAAVVGEVFWVGALAATASLPRPVVEERLRVLERKEFLRRERASSVANELQYTFRHVVVREVAYGQLPRARRAERHRIAAEWLESLAPSGSDDRAELLAHHYLSALELGRAAGRDVSGLVEPARAAAARAGRHATSLNAHAAAARFYAAALELTEADDDERARLLLRVGESLFHAEQGGAEQLEQAREALLATSDPERSAVADVLLATLLVNQGSHGAAQEHLERAAALLRDAPPTRGKVFVLSSWARFLVRARKPDEAIVVGREALAMAERLGLDDLRAQALDNVGVARLAKGDQGGAEDFERSLAVAAAIRSPESTRAYRFLASTLAMQGELERSFELFGEGRRAAERFGDAFEQRWLRAALAAECYWRGHWSGALSRADEFIAAAAAGSPHYMETACRRVRGLIRLARGDIAGAVDDAERSLDVARNANDPWHLNQALALRARTLVVAGDADEASDSADELLRTWSAGEGPVPSFESFDLAVALFALERGQELEDVPSITRWFRAATAYARGDFVGAAALAAEIGSRPEEAYARLQAGGADEIERGLAFFRQVGASAYVAAAERGSRAR
jgi:tetratricopeptide (TPR) repeat protein